MRWGVPRPEAEEVTVSRKREPEAPRERIEAAPVTQAPEEPPLPRPLEEAAPQQEEPTEPRRPGKGGAEHTYLQELVKRWAEERGFRAMVEEQIPGTRESVDVALYRGDTRIACEITVTTPLEYEVGNVEKCLAANFGIVAVISLKKGRLAKLDKLLSSSLPPDKYAQVHLFTPEELLSWLSGQPAEEREGEVRGYKVKVRYKAPNDAKSKRVAEILARSMSRLEREE